MMRGRIMDSWRGALPIFPILGLEFPCLRMAAGVRLFAWKRARNSKHPETKPKSQNSKPSRDPTNPNHPIASLVPAHVPDQLQPKTFLILDELSLSYHPGQLAFPDSKRPVRTRRSSRSRSDSKQLASPISRSRPQPQSVRSQLASRPARVQSSSRFILWWSGFNNQLS
ncbi:hypothetical protein F2Q69_00023454 [Brassica cretica]|uniref:Uncharacterized protein n=1 Tax=Brassica cretica TaxID=69181 RepID=A0A8S9QL00_BRACR|nr:hypothetical protein F2Q69_00023454 [Brassica cretica]